MKQYFTGFFTATCLTISIFLFMGLDEGPKVMKPFIIDGEKGNTIFTGAQIIITNNNHSKISASIGVEENGGGFISVANIKGKSVGVMRVDQRNSGVINLLDSG